MARRLLSVMLAAAMAASGLVALPAPARAEACSVPVTQRIRGIDVDFDQCYDHTFTRDGVTHEVHVYYTEQNTAANTGRCTGDDAADDDGDGVPDRCEHAIANIDDANGDNVVAVSMAEEVEPGWRFYLDNDIDVLSGETELDVFIAEDPKNGGVPTDFSINVNDDLYDNADFLNKRRVAFHEMMHLVQKRYNDEVGFRSFYGEGIARASEDRFDTPLDQSTGYNFMNQSKAVLADTEGVRSTSIDDASYHSMLWWTWLFDQYRAAGDSEPALGWDAIRDFYLELAAADDQLAAVSDFIGDQGGSFRDDFIDYTLALYAYRYAGGDDRVGFVDTELNTATSGLGGHLQFTNEPISEISQTVDPRSPRYWEYVPDASCPYVAFSFDGRGEQFGFSVLTVAGSTLDQRWTRYGTEWARTVRTDGLDRVAGVVTGWDTGGTVDVRSGCTEPSVRIKLPTTAAFAAAGLATDPRRFIVRLDVDGPEGDAVAGLTPDAFDVTLRAAGGGPDIPAEVVSAAYSQDDYWLLVQAPDQAAGAQTGAFYDLSVALGSATDTQASAVLYVERTLDRIVVLDRSGSMADGGRLTAAQNAANLMVNELADDDQGAYVVFDEVAELRAQLAEVGAGHRAALEAQIAAETAGGATSIGGGMQVAAAEEDARGVDDHLCTFVLLSDGWQNEVPLWDDVRDEVVDNGCAIDAVGYGPHADEVLLAQIAASVPGGTYDFADVDGDVPLFDSAGPTFAADGQTLGWENHLSRVYSYQVAQAAGRQRILSAAGEVSSVPQTSAFVVDETTDLLVVSTGWQSPVSRGATFLTDPDGTPVSTALRRPSSQGTNEVWEVHDPPPGQWTLTVRNLGQESITSVTARTDLELRLLVGVTAATRGTPVPILGMLTGPDGPILDGAVTAIVRDPDGVTRSLLLHDDGEHGDGEPDDGVYGNVYTATSLGDVAATSPADGEEPAVVGSYQVEALSVVGDVRREAQGSFALSQGDDSDGDELPDDWESRHGLDPADPDDADRDHDDDGLPNRCEFEVGTDPRTSDTDGGGERDDSEVVQPGGGARCRVDDRDPLDPDDDRVGPLRGAGAVPEAEDGDPFVTLDWSPPERGELVGLDIWCRTVEPLTDWVLVAELSGPDLNERHYDHRDVAEGQRVQCRLDPTVRSEGGEDVPARVEPTDVVDVSADPYPPFGTILIDGGAPSTPRRTVTLDVSATDRLADDHDGGDGAVVQGSPTAQLQMRLSNDLDFTGVPFEPFRAVVPGWDLGDVRPGQVADVHVQFRDEAGNTSLVETESILYAPPSRFAGETRIETAIAISQADFSDGSASAALVARADDFPDALTGTPLAVAKGGPTLLTPTGALPAAVADELARVLPAGRTVYVLGGEVAVGAPVAAQLEALGYDVARLAGPTRVETAIAIAREIGDPDPLFLTTGVDHPDALAAGPAAARNGGAVLLSAGDRPHPATAAYLAERADATRYAVGGPAVRAHPEAEPIVGSGREATAVAVARRFFAAPPVLGVARTEVFADALTGGPHVARLGGPILLTAGAVLHPEAEAYACEHQGSLSGAFVYGGTAAVTAAVAAQIDQRIRGQGCP